MQDSAGNGMAATVGPCASIPADHMAFIRQVLDRVGDKWSMLIIAVLEGGPMRYTDLQRQIPGISYRSCVGSSSSVRWTRRLESSHRCVARRSS
ncbi:winged helix-turn-helix transcriptional regulator [Streptomyces ureilyticus]|uniref:Helix-turn-helix transcriptional regulator n=1 Tax=Streptomyces ureilyticus TaxID=1775131 RepID=A0ABX0DYQ9_9ACTN|nr:helix-turn-helix transcriptional regulator [Streptomyces ureilyticus]